MSKPNLVFIPGLLCTGELYAAQIAALGDRVNYQIADHGAYDDIAACAEAILERAPQSFVPVGLSMGGYITFELLRQAPDRVERFVIIDSSSRPDKPEQSGKRLEMIALAQTSGMDAVAEALVPSMLGRSNRKDEYLLAMMRDMSNETGPVRFANQQKLIMSRPDTRPDLASFDQTALVIVGEEDVLTPKDVNEEIADGLPNADLAIILECGHLATIEAPEAVSAALEDFLLGDVL